MILVIGVLISVKCLNHIFSGCRRPSIFELLTFEDQAMCIASDLCTNESQHNQTLQSCLLKSNKNMACNRVQESNLRGTWNCAHMFCIVWYFLLQTVSSLLNHFATPRTACHSLTQRRPMASGLGWHTRRLPSQVKGLQNFCKLQVEWSTITRQFRVMKPNQCCQSGQLEKFSVVSRKATTSKSHVTCEVWKNASGARSSQVPDSLTDCIAKRYKQYLQTHKSSWQCSNSSFSLTASMCGLQWDENQHCWQTPLFVRR